MKDKDYEKLAGIGFFFTLAVASVVGAFIGIGIATWLW